MLLKKHLWIGLALSLFMVVSSLSGVLLLYEDHLLAQLYPWFVEQDFSPEKASMLETASLL